MCVVIIKGISTRIQTSYNVSMTKCLFPIHSVTTFCVVIMCGNICKYHIYFYIQHLIHISSIYMCLLIYVISIIKGVVMGYFDPYPDLI